MNYCEQEPKSLELMNINKYKIKMNNLHFIPNNILIRLFKELKKLLSIIFKL